MSVVHPCESTYGPCRLAYTLERTACAAPQTFYILLPLLWHRTATELCLAVPFLGPLIYILIHIQTPSTCTQIQVYIDLQPNFIQNYVRMKRFMNSEVLIKAVWYDSSQICNSQCTWPDMESSWDVSIRDSDSCTLHCRVARCGKDFLIGRTAFKNKNSAVKL